MGLTLPELPLELLGSIASNLGSLRDVCSFGLACRALHRALDTHLFFIDATFFGSSALIWAAVNGRASVARRSLSHGGDVNTRFNPNYYEREYPLTLAAHYGHIDVIRCLLEAGADLNVSDGEWKTSLHKAAAAGHRNVIELLLDAGACPSALDRMGETPIVAATRTGRLNSLMPFLDPSRGFNLNRISGDADPPLVVAATHGFGHIAAALLAHGVPLESQGIEDFTPLCIAAIQGHAAFVKQLADKGALVDNPDSVGFRPLYFAAREGHINVIKLLLELGAALERPDARSLMLVAVDHGREEVVRFLIARGVSPESTDDNESKPLHYAAYRGHETILKLLLEHGAEPEATSRIGTTALVSAVNQCHEGVVKLLLEYGADPESAASGWCGEPLLQAASRGQLGIGKLLLAHGANPNAQGYGKRSALHLVADDEIGSFTRLLIEAGANPNVKDDTGLPPLWGAVRQGHQGTVGVLLKLGATAHVSDRSQVTLLDMAIKYDNAKIVKMLTEFDLS